LSRGRPARAAWRRPRVCFQSGVASAAKRPTCRRVGANHYLLFESLKRTKHLIPLGPRWLPLRPRPSRPLRPRRRPLRPLRRPRRRPRRRPLRRLSGLATCKTAGEHHVHHPWSGRANEPVERTIQPDPAKDTRHGILAHALLPCRACTGVQSRIMYTSLVFWSRGCTEKSPGVGVCRLHHKVATLHGRPVRNLGRLLERLGCHLEAAGAQHARQRCCAIGNRQNAARID